MKKFLYISSILTFLIFFYLIGTYIFYLCNMSIDIQDPHHGYSITFLVYYCSGTIAYLVYYIFHFAFPYNYKDKYLRIVFLIDYIGVIIHLLVCLYLCIFTNYRGEFLMLAFPFVIALFIYMSIMGYIRFIKSKEANK